MRLDAIKMVVDIKVGILNNLMEIITYFMDHIISPPQEEEIAPDIISSF